MPLTPEQYQAGSRVRDPDGQDYDVTDTFRGASGNEYLILSAVDGSDLALKTTADVRDEWEARDPDEVAQERQDARDLEDNPKPDVPDVPDVPDANGDTPPADESNPNQ